jgi:hypothetical protein
MAVFFVFGTQEDIFNAFKFWEKRPVAPRLSVGSLERIGSHDSVKKESAV